MRDLYLRFDTEVESRSQLIKLGFSEDQGGLYHPNISLDLVGVIVHSSGEGDSIRLTIEEGYHVNLRVMDDELDLSPLKEFIISPKTPFRTWA